MAAAGSDRLSDLPDDLLRHVLRFAPSREAASTAVLSRRWRSLWPSPWDAAVNLDSRSYDRGTHGGDASRKRDAFFRGAAAALAAHAQSGVRSLAVHVEASECYDVRRFMFRGGSESEEEEPDIVDDVLRHPACRRVEELRIGSEITSAQERAFRQHEWFTLAREHHEGHYELSFGAVPAEALRALHIINCGNLTPPPPGATFRCLETLRLRQCTVSIDSLQDMIVASPQLATLHLEYVFLAAMVYDHRDENQYNYYYYNYDPHPLPVDGLCCPGITTLVLMNCCHKEEIDIELDVPRLQHFRYRGHMNRFPLKSVPPDVSRADLHFLNAKSIQDDQLHILFWQFLRNFRNAKALKLKMKWPMEDIAVADKKRHEELLGGMLFSNLESLEIDGQYMSPSKVAAVAIGNFLHCCPVVCDLRLKFNILNHKPRLRGYYLTNNASRRKRDFLHKNAQADFSKSVEYFSRCKDPIISMGGDDGTYEVHDLPGLSEDRFDCLQGYLRRVRLQFLMDKPNGFGARLAKYFVENAVVLEEIYIDDGNKKLWEHMNRKVDRWAGDSVWQPCSDSSDFTGTSLSSQEVCNNNQFNASEIRRKILPWNPKLKERNLLSTRVKVLPLER